MQLENNFQTSCCMADRDSSPTVEDSALLARDSVTQSSNSGHSTTVEQEAWNTHQELSPDLLVRVLKLLPPNEIVCSARRVCTYAWSHLSAVHYRTAHLGQPLPSHAAEWAHDSYSHLLPALPFRRKLLLLCTAAASGSGTNLSVAWLLLQPCLFTELPPERYAQLCWEAAGTEPGTAAAAAGHPHLLRWLVQHRTPLHGARALEAVACHCGLPALHAAWELLRNQRAGGCHVSLTDAVLDAAAGSLAPDAVEKVAWVLEQGSSGGGSGDSSSSGGRCSLRAATAAAAAKAGNLLLLRWLRDRGCPCGTVEVLAAALGGVGVGVAQWVLAAGGLQLEQLPAAAHAQLAAAAAAAADPAAPEVPDQGEDFARGCVEPLVWLQQRGVRLQGDVASSREVGQAALVAAAGQGRLRAMRNLLQECHVPPTHAALVAAAGCGSLGSVPAAACLLAAGCTAHPATYGAAAARGDLAAVRWLVEEARCPWDVATLSRVIHVWPLAGSKGCVGAGDSSCGYQFDGGSATAAAAHSATGGSAATPADGPSLVAEGISSGDPRLLEAVQLLVAAGCPADGTWTLHRAVDRGDLPLVRYLLRHCPGCELHWETLGNAATAGCEQLLQWLVCEAGCRETEGYRGGPYANAVQNGDVATLMCLRRLGVAWGGDVLSWAVLDRQPLAVCRLLVEQGAPVVAGAVEEALGMAGRLGMEEEVVVWLKGLRGRGGGGRSAWG